MLASSLTDAAENGVIDATNIKCDAYLYPNYLLSENDIDTNYICTLSVSAKFY